LAFSDLDIFLCIELIPISQVIHMTWS
jgi:hypothetical protein